MAQIQVRDDNGQPIRMVNIRISEGEKPSEAAIFDVFTDLSGNTGWPIPFFPVQDYTLHVNKQNVLEDFDAVSIFVPGVSIATSVDIPITLPRRAAPANPGTSTPRADRATLLRRPRIGMNISALLVNTKHDIPETLKRFVDAGVELTDVNWLSALWPGVDCLPFKIPASGPFDLFDFNAQFFERAHEIRESFNAAGIVVQGTFWETYSWSSRHVGRPGIPDGNLGPWRNNKNGVKLGGAYNGDRKEDDESLTKLMPTEFCAEFLRRLLPFWDASINPVRLGNELPEKDLHKRLRNLVKSIDPSALVIVNRQDDTPGQYDNMKIGVDYDFIELHGSNLKTLDDLTAPWHKDDSHVPSYQAMLDDADAWRITFSSDGARSGPGKDGPDDPYEWDSLWALFREVHAQGCSVLHQSRAKMTPAPNHHMIEVDRFRALRS